MLGAQIWVKRMVTIRHRAQPQHAFYEASLDDIRVGEPRVIGLTRLH